jgi:lysophospholipase L1-like esterase
VRTATCARPDYFRLGWATFCLLLWWAAVEIAEHRSANPAVLGRWSTAWFAVLAGAAASAASASAGLLPRLYPRFRAARGAVALSGLLTLLLTVTSLETLFRLDFLGASYHEETARYLRETLPDQKLNYRHRPGFRTTYQDRAVSFNELGLRDRPLEAKASGESRLVILGDSVAFGWGVPEEDTFGRQLEQRLGDCLGRPVRTVNTGVCSYNTVQQLRFLRRQGAQLDPDAVLLLYVENDVLPFLPVERDGSMLSVRGRPGRLTDWLLARSWTYRVAYHLSRPMLAGETLDPEAAGYRDSLAALASLAETSADLGAEFAVIVYRMARRPASDRLVEDIRAVGEAAGFSVADAAPWFAGRDLRGLTNSVTDTHPNAAGHALLAEGAADFLRRNKLPPAAPR